jgi:hypothetical protein
LTAWASAAEATKPAMAQDSSMVLGRIGIMVVLLPFPTPPQ